MRFFPLLFLVFLACASCKKNAQQPGDPANTMVQQLLGTWNWVLQYNNGIYSGTFTGNPTGDSLTPASTGIHETLTFNTHSQWIVVQNGATVVEGSYKIASIDAPGPAGAARPLLALDLMRPGKPDSLVNHVIYQDTLVISNMLINPVGVNRVYVRANASAPNNP